MPFGTVYADAGGVCLITTYNVGIHAGLLHLIKESYFKQRHRVLDVAALMSSLRRCLYGADRVAESLICAVQSSYRFLTPDSSIMQLDGPH